MTKPFIALLLTGLLACFSLSVQAYTYYKWTDPNGVPHYSQYAPTNGVSLKKVQVINTQELAPPTSTATQSTDAVAPQPTSPEQQQAAQADAQKKAQQQQQTKEQCKSLQNNLANLNVGGRVYEMDDKGERKYLDSREIELRREKVAQAISQYCKS